MSTPSARTRRPWRDPCEHVPTCKERQTDGQHERRGHALGERSGAGAAVEWWKLLPGGDEAVVHRCEGIQRGYERVPPQECGSRQEQDRRLQQDARNHEHADGAWLEHQRWILQVARRGAHAAFKPLLLFTKLICASDISSPAHFTAVTRVARPRRRRSRHSGRASGPGCDTSSRQVHVLDRRYHGAALERRSGADQDASHRRHRIVVAVRAA